MATAAGIPDTQQPAGQKDLYYRDYYTWTRQQADALRRRDFEAVDWENITEEIEALVTRQQLEAHDWFPDHVRLVQRPQGRQQPA